MIPYNQYSVHSPPELTKLARIPGHTLSSSLRDGMSWRSAVSRWSATGLYSLYATIYLYSLAVVVVISSYQSVISLTFHGRRVIHEIKCKHFYWCAWQRVSVCSILAQQCIWQCGVIRCHVELISWNNGSIYFLQSIFTTIAMLNHFVQQLLLAVAGNSVLNRHAVSMGLVPSGCAQICSHRLWHQKRNVQELPGSVRWCCLMYCTGHRKPELKSRGSPQSHLCPS